MITLKAVVTYAAYKVWLSCLMAPLVRVADPDPEPYYKKERIRIRIKKSTHPDPANVMEKKKNYKELTKYVV